MDKIIRVGLVGYGVGGQVFHAPVLTAVNGLVLTKIRAVKEDQVALASERYPAAVIVKDADEIINDPLIDLVIIVTPNTSHFSLAKQALLAGKHVVVDKPFTITSTDADALILLAGKSGKVLSVFHSRRFDSDFRTIQKLISSTILGKIVELESRYDRFRNYLKNNAWREDAVPGSGILYDLGSHLIDQALVLFGLPNAVTADIRIQRAGGKTDDNFELILHYQDVKVTLKAGMLVRQPLFRFALMGTEGSFIKHGMDVQEDALKAGLTPLTEAGWGIEPQKIYGVIKTSSGGIEINETVKSEKGSYTDFYQNIYDTISGNTKLIVTPVHARNVIRVIEVAFQSEKEKRTIDFTVN